MAFNVSTTHFMDFVQLVVSGPASIKTFVDLVKTAEQESLNWAHKRALVDLRGVGGRLEEAEQVFLGELVAQHLPHLEKLASIVHRDQLTHNSETGARNLNMRLRVFVEKEEALEWLLEGPRSGAGAPPPRSYQLELRNAHPPGE